MNDKLKVWKCDDCVIPCFAIMISEAPGLAPPKPQCCLAHQDDPYNWQPTDEYELVKKEDEEPEINVVAKVPTRYRLEIPEEVKKGYCITVANLREFDGKPLDFNEYSSMLETFHNDEYVKSWLIPIVEDDRPLTDEERAEKWVEQAKQHVFYTNESRSSLAKRSFLAGEKSNELKHRETDSFKEWVLRFTHGKLDAEFTYEHLKKCWQACLKSRGFDE